LREACIERTVTEIDGAVVDDCIFCKIAAGKAFVRMVYATDDTMCFFPLEPEVLGHTLICSRRHFSDVRDAPATMGAAVFEAAQLLSRHYSKTLGTSSFNLMNASGVEAEQSVQHLHFHFLPRFASDAFSTWPSLPAFKTDLDALLDRLKF
jgi:histidine triad (HIT) family protein